MKVGQKYSLGGETVARVLEIRGWFFKRYICAVWGEDKNGKHIWPTSGHYINEVSKKEIQL